MNNYLSPAELLASYSAAGVRKMERSAASLLLLGALAGAIIAIAAAATNTAVYGISDTWTVRTICGLLFPFGLGLVVVTGAELFTGNCMLPLTLLEKKGGSAVLMVRNWALVFAGNALGSPPGPWPYTPSGSGPRNAPFPSAAPWAWACCATCWSVWGCWPPPPPGRHRAA